ncbi:MAG: hypothetical protein ACI4LC_07730 [Emergencia sp.]
MFTGITMLGVVAVLMACIAWFAANNQAMAGGSMISTNGNYTFSIATLRDDSNQGVYDANESQNAETPLAKALNKFFRADNNGRDDEEGNHYTSFLNLPNLSVGSTSFTDSEGKEYIIGDSDGISLMVKDESNVNNTNEFDHIGPGSYGKFTFYIIPYIENLNQVRLSVTLHPFTLVREGDPSDKKAVGKAELLANTPENQDLLNILQGHILLFTGKDNDGNYSNRILPKLESDGTISFMFEKNSGNTTWVKDKPEPITIYWIWPKRFENIKYCGQEESVFASVCQSHTDLLTWINEHRDYIVKANTDSLKNPSETMTNQEFAQWSAGYNKGDQLIGDNIAFFQWIIDAV